MTNPSELRFDSGDSWCAALHHPGSGDACVVMAAGLGGTKEPATNPFASRFRDTGYRVLAFDYRGLGASGGTRRQVVDIREQLRDWDAALACAAELPGVDPRRLVAWGFSLSGGHVLRVAARHRELAAAIAQSPNADGRAATRRALRHQTAGAAVRLIGRAVVDTIAGTAGRPPSLVPLAGPRGAVAVLTTPDAADAERAFDPVGEFRDSWPRSVAARSVLPLGSYRPGRDAADILCPLLVVVADDDQSALAAPAVDVASRAPQGEVVRVPGGHYASYLDAHEQVVAAEVDFLRRHVPTATRTGADA